MQILLSSNGLKSRGTLDKFLSLSASLNRKVAIITTASVDHKAQNRNVVALRDTLAAWGFTTTCVDVEFDPPSLMDGSDTIILSGGNPYYLAHYLKTSGGEGYLKDRVGGNYLTVGISAGIFVMMSDLGIVDALTPEMNGIGLTDKSGMALIPDVVVPHYDRFLAEGRLEEQTIRSYEKSTGQPVIRLGEEGFLCYEVD